MARAVVGFVVFLGAGYVSLFLLPRLADPERRASVKLAASLVFGGIFVLATAWAPAVTAAAKSEAEELLASYCEMSGDQVFRTVEHVDGLLIQPPPAGDVRAKHFHTDDQSHSAYVFPPKRTYKFLEIGSNKPNERIRRYEHPVIDGKSRERMRPTARYALTWVDTTRIQEGNAGLFGEQVIVYDRLTNEVLARRTHHYLVERRKQGQIFDTIHTCDQVDIGTDSRYTDRRPRSSYSFVSRVLIPTPDSPMFEPKKYVLEADSGFLMMDCGPSGVDLSKQISRENLLVRREGVDLFLDRTDSRDRLICTHFFDEGEEPSPEKMIRLHDGTALDWNEIIR